jgi:hypothetical protein
MTSEKNDSPAPVATASGETTTLLNKSGAKGILCAKCSHVNRAGSTKCSRCESHLHIKCNDCGTRNERFHTRCQTCGRRLHRSFFEKLGAGGFKRQTRVTPLQIVLLLIFAAVAFYCVVIMQHVQLPPVQQ